MTTRPAVLTSEYVAKGWCQFAMAVDAKGHGCLENDPRAVAWCILGAGSASLGGMSGEQWQPWWKAATKLLGRPDGLAPWNNAPERTQAEVVAFAQAVEKKLGWLA